MLNVLSCFTYKDVQRDVMERVVRATSNQAWTVQRTLNHP